MVIDDGEKIYDSPAFDEFFVFGGKRILGVRDMMVKNL
jgi:hypothetical protein